MTSTTYPDLYMTKSSSNDFIFMTYYINKPPCYFFTFVAHLNDNLLFMVFTIGLILTNNKSSHILQAYPE